jgi:pimeloyl-ACP methyl ester carboxylesterase
MLDDYSGWHWTHDNPATNIDPPASERLGLLQSPALIVTGADDLPYNALVAERLAREIPDGTSLCIENAGHMANLEAPDAVNAAIAAFAARVATGAV